MPNVLGRRPGSTAPVPRPSGTVAPSVRPAPSGLPTTAETTSPAEAVGCSNEPPRTFSRAAAEVLAAFTGSAFFPGGLGEFVAPQNAFLKFELDPSETVVLQWATYYDASNEAGLSRLYGGIHPFFDDFGGRLMGATIGRGAFTLAQQYYAGTVTVTSTSTTTSSTTTTTTASPTTTTSTIATTG